MTSRLELTLHSMLNRPTAFRTGRVQFRIQTQYPITCEAALSSLLYVNHIFQRVAYLGRFS